MSLYAVAWRGSNPHVRGINEGATQAYQYIKDVWFHCLHKPIVFQLSLITIFKLRSTIVYIISEEQLKETLKYLKVIKIQLGLHFDTVVIGQNVNLK